MLTKNLVYLELTIVQQTVAQLLIIGRGCSMIWD